MIWNHRSLLPHPPLLASMKHKFNIATWWRHFSVRKVVKLFYTLTTKIPPPGGEIQYFFSIQTTLNFLLYHMQKRVSGYPRSGSFLKFWANLKKRPKNIKMGYETNVRTDQRLIINQIKNKNLICLFNLPIMYQLRIVLESRRPRDVRTFFPFGSRLFNNVLGKPFRYHLGTYRYS